MDGRRTEPSQMTERAIKTEIEKLTKAGKSSSARARELIAEAERLRTKKSPTPLESDGGVALTGEPVTTRSGRTIRPPKPQGTVKQRLQHIDDWLWTEALKETDVTLLEDLLITAIGEAQRTSSEKMAEQYAKLTGGFNLPF